MDFVDWLAIRHTASPGNHGPTRLDNWLAHIFAVLVTKQLQYHSHMVEYYQEFCWLE